MSEDSTQAARNIVLGTLALLAAKAKEDWDDVGGEQIANWITEYAQVVMADGGPTD